MKIGIVTTYDELNFGAYLQAYSLQAYLCRFGHEVFFIRYKSFDYHWAEIKATFKIKNPFYLFKIVLKYLKFKKALKNLSISRKYKNLSEVNCDQYDLIFYGSDEIWNLENCLGSIVDAYYYGDKISSKKIAYATSFGSCKSISAKHENIQSLLLQFSKISVRDANSQKIIQSIGYKHDVPIVLDPTFLVNQPIAPVVQISEPYIFYYCVNRDREFDLEVKRFAEKNNLSVISFGYKHKFFKNMINLDPFEWLSYLKLSQYVVTDMFHGTIFSIKYKKKFVSNVTEYRENKLGFLLELLELRPRAYMFGSLEQILDAPINYDRTANICGELLSFSESYIHEALNDL